MATLFNITIIQALRLNFGQWRRCRWGPVCDHQQEVVNQSPRKGILVVLDEWNAYVGEDALKNWEGTCGSLRKQPTFRIATFGPPKWRLRNDCRNSIQVTCHYLDLDSASDTLTPIFKKDDATEIGNYRPISLPSIPSKILGSEVKDSLVHNVRNMG